MQKLQMETKSKLYYKENMNFHEILRSVKIEVKTIRVASVKNENQTEIFIPSGVFHEKFFDIVKFKLHFMRMEIQFSPSSSFCQFHTKFQENFVKRLFSFSLLKYFS